MNKARLITFAAILLTTQSAWGETTSTSGNYYQVITDSTFSSENGYLPEFGYAVFLNFEGARVLFDTGVTPDALEHNLKIAGIDPESIEILVLSHNHTDHIGGLAYLRTANPGIKVYAPPDQEIDNNPVTRLTDVLEITPNLYAIRTHTDTPTVGISDELSIVARTKNGPYLLTACSHTGVSTIVRKAADVIGQPVFHYTGGARLKFRGAEDTQQVADQLNHLNVSQVSPGHCSVDHAIDRTLNEYFRGQVLTSMQGKKVSLSPPSPPCC